MYTRRTIAARASMLLIAIAVPTLAFAQQPPAPVVAARIVEREVAAGQTFVATVQATKLAVIGSAASGRVSERFFEEGDRVESMKPLAQLLTETITSEIDAAEAELAFQESVLEELENGVRPEELEQASARMQAAAARRDYTTQRRKRAEESGTALSLNDRDEAVSLHVEAANNYADMKAAYDLAKLGPRTEKIAQAKAQVAMQRAVVKKLVDQKRKHTIIARFDGYVVKQYTEVGAWLSTGDLVCEVAALDEVDIEAFVGEQHVANITLGMEIGVEIPALNGEVVTGKVHRVIPQADLKTRTFPIRIRVKNTIVNKVPLLKSGMMARVHLPTGSRRLAQLVPKDALVLSGVRRAVMVIDVDPKNPQQGTVRPVPVEVGVASGGLIQVTGQLQPQQLVVIEGNERLRPGQAVKIAEVREPKPL